ncbi:unnamed protein product [Amoebophrya sp. A25]|nr:unnamed protein product [Amoebophrya sp. A25]|eukprot:GSA25T00023397001.1
MCDHVWDIWSRLPIFAFLVLVYFTWRCSTNARAATESAFELQAIRSADASKVLGHQLFSERDQERGYETITKSRMSFFDICRRSRMSDKCASNQDRHYYHVLYEFHLSQLRDRDGPARFLEIGLGCTMRHGAGGSREIWEKYFNRPELWFGEYNAKCVDEYKRRHPGFSRIMVGDQSNRTDLARWVETSGGNFDVIVDDGGHRTPLQMGAFYGLFPSLKPGGLYFIEDIHYQRDAFDRKTKMSGVLRTLLDWSAQLVGVSRIAKPYSSTLPPDIQSIECMKHMCMIVKKDPSLFDKNPRTGHAQARPTAAVGRGPESFYDICKRNLLSDKCSDRQDRHFYHVLYESHLRHLRKRREPVRFFEIGLGCTMRYGAGGSRQIWEAYFDHVDLWFGEYNRECVKQYRENNPNFKNIVEGDQSNKEDLQRWVAASGGNFDVVVDDGGHRTPLQMGAFYGLFPHVKPGGLYFIEDIHYQKDGTDGHSVHSAVLRTLLDWSAQLVGVVDSSAYESKVPDDVQSIECMMHMCMIVKKDPALYPY